MKLLAKNTLLLFIVTLLVFILGGILFYIRLENIISEEATESLMSRKWEMDQYIKKNNKLPDSYGGGTRLNFQTTDYDLIQQINDTNMFVEAEKELLPFRQLKYGTTVQGQKYIIAIRVPLFESDDLAETILVSFSITLGFLLFLFLLINYIFSKNTWKPFFKTLARLKNYNIEHHAVLENSKTPVFEFTALNEAVHKMTKKIAEDYNNLKAFTENASHEIQTPLAIIKNETELMMQSDSLNEAQLRQIIKINHTISKLTKLNQILLLLTKIENNQFNKKESVRIDQLILQKLEESAELLHMKNLSVQKILHPVQLQIHPGLADIFISNLLSNAIKYTSSGGQIEIEANESFIEFRNTGKKLQAKGDEIFNRFYKEDSASESTGLGLALVKQIALANKNTVHYGYNAEQHVFRYVF